MPQATEPRSASPTQASVQDVFLNQARRDRATVRLRLMDGRQIDARIKGFDRFAVIVEVAGADHLIFKHAIATIESSRSVADYFTPQHS